MPKPQSANPAKPAPSFNTISRCSAGTALALAAPWMSTNCARMYLSLFSFRYFLAAWGDMCFSLPRLKIDGSTRRSFQQGLSTDHTAAQFRRDFRKRLPEILREGRIAPDSIAGRLAKLGSDHKDTHADHL